MRPQIEPGREHEIQRMSALLREEFNITTPYTPVKRMLLFFSTIHYFESDAMNPDFFEESGFSVYTQGDYHTYINAGLPDGRDVFTLGHELGHIALGHHIIYDSRELSLCQYQYADAEADTFAASLLMPAEWVRAYTDGSVCPALIGKLKTLFAVSWQAMIIRLDELGIQSQNESKRMLNELKAAAS